MADAQIALLVEALHEILEHILVAVDAMQLALRDHHPDLADERPIGLHHLLQIR